VDKAGNTIDFLFRAKRDKAAARCLFDKAMAENGTPETVTMDKSTSNLATLHAVNAERGTPIEIRQVKYLNNIVEQDHRAIKRITRPMVVFKDFDRARVIRSGIKVTHMIEKGADDIRKQTEAFCCRPDLPSYFISSPYQSHFCRPSSLLRQKPPKQYTRRKILN
jgi:transposase-like protein